MPHLSPELNEITGRLLLIGFEGTAWPELEKLIREVRPGGVIFFSRNYSQETGPEGLKYLLHSASQLGQKLLGRQLLLAIDHEGGRVQRLPKPFTPIPPPGAAENPAEAARWAGCGARELAAVGFNLNLAPVLDLAPSGKNFLGDRSFGENPDRVTACGRAVLQALEEAGVLGSGKHFPGLGRATLDPHEELPTIGVTEEVLVNSDFIPFTELKGQLATIMTTHARYPALDPQNPATFSPSIVARLKKKLNFEGAVLTDDLEMGAVTRHRSLGQATVEAIIAGHDLALICRRRDFISQSQEALALAVTSGHLSQIRLEDAFSRLDGLNRRLKAISPPPGKIQEWFEQLTRNT